MITTFELGKLYAISGMGPWGKLKKDVIISSISLTSEMERLKIDLFAKAFKEYDVDEETYAKYVLLNPKVYHGKVLDERKISAIDSASEDIYFLESMIAKDVSEELIPCKVFKWGIKSTPFATDLKVINATEDDAKFLEMMNTFDMKVAIENAIKDKLPETVTEEIDYEEIFTTKTEYDEIRLQRQNRFSEAQKAEFERRIKENLISQATTDKLIECNNRAENLKILEMQILKQKAQISEIENNYLTAAEVVRKMRDVLKEVFNKIKNDPSIPNNPLAPYETFEDFYNSFV